MPNTFNSLNTPPPVYLPAVSVIIPMYNAEKYVAECLESLLAQTFPHFEVIIVNDCSNDSSCKIVERYIPKFYGRLILSHMEENTGSGALPRNKGLRFSRGEYVFFMDADDMLTKTALEELYTLAKNFDADVVYCEKYYTCSANRENLRLTSEQNHVFVNRPTFDSENLVERVQGILNERYWVTPWCKLVRRNLLIEHEINFPHCAISEDDIWTYGLVFYAKKFLRVPNVTYVYRLNENSVGQRKKSPQQMINFWMSPLLLRLKALDKLMSRHKFFLQNSQYRYLMLDFFLRSKFGALLQASFQVQPFEIYETLKQKFGKHLGEYDVLIPALCTLINTQQKISLTNQQKFNQFAAQAQQRIAQLESELNKKT